MGSPRERDDVVVPLRLEQVGASSQGARRRSTALVAAALVVFVALGVGLGVLSSDHRPSRLPPLILSEVTPTPLEAPTVAPSQRVPPSRIPLATSLPALEITGKELPTERRPIYADGIELLDVASGSLTRLSPPTFDQVLPVGDDQLVCACVSGVPAGSDPSNPTPTVRFARYDLGGQQVSERSVLSFDGIVPVPNQTDGFNAASALSDDRHVLYVLTVARRPPMWWVDLNLIDVDSGALLGGRTIGRFPVDLDTALPQPTPTPAPDGPPPNGAYAWAAFVVPAPDGRTVMISVQTSEWRDGNGINRDREWMVPVRGDRPGTPIRLDANVTLPAGDWCMDGVWFVDATMAATYCLHDEVTGASRVYLRRLMADGTSPGNIPIDGLRLPEGFMSTTVDRRSGAVMAWDPVDHTLVRAEMDSGRYAVSSVPGELLPGGSTSDRWRVVQSPALVLSPDGNRAYAIGSGPRGTSSGVWVFDPRTLELLDHWEPRAVLNSIAISADGRFVYATGVPGLDVDGNDNPLWQASVTVYDAASGEQQRLFGAEGADQWLTFPNWR